MKLKLTSIAIAAILCAANSKATILGITTNYSKLNVSLTVYTNTATTTNNGVEHTSIGRARISNKELLAAFADWNGVTISNKILSDPTWKNAQLIYDWQSNQVCVADSSGTNILFYAGTGINSGGTNGFFTLNWIDGTGPFSRTRVTTNPGSDKFTEDDRGFFEYSYSNSNTGDSTDVWGRGGKVEQFAQYWDSNGNFTSWSDSESFRPINADNTVVLHNENFCAVDGTISASGKGKGSNPFLTPDE